MLTFQEIAALPSYSPVIVRTTSGNGQNVVERKALIYCHGLTIVAELTIKKGIHRSLNIQSVWEKTPGIFTDSWGDCHYIRIDEQPLHDECYSYPEARRQSQPSSST